MEREFNSRGCSTEEGVGVSLERVFYWTGHIIGDNKLNFKSIKSNIKPNFKLSFEQKMAQLLLLPAVKNH